jgi:hypothetical protein
MPNITDATSYYRGMGPLGRLKNQMELMLNFTIEINWATLGACDVLFMQRAYSKKHYEALQIAKDVGTPIWLDYDDDLFNLSDDNPAAKLYRPEETQRTIAKCCAIADVITVSTEHLKDRLGPLNKNIEIIPNAFDERRWHGQRFPLNPERKKVLMWRGSSTHYRDLMLYAPQIIEISKKHTDWGFYFFGFNPWMLTEHMPHERTMVNENHLDIVQYHRLLGQMQPVFLMVPLVPSTFNYSKSNIAWIEGTWARANCIVPKWKEWDQPGAYTYESQETFFTTLDKRMGGYDPVVEDCYNRMGYEYIQEHLTLTKVNALREKVIRGLVK